MDQFEHYLLEQLSEKYRPLNAAFVSVLGGIQLVYFPRDWCGYVLLALGFAFVLIGIVKISAKVRVSLMSLLFSHTLIVALVCPLNVVVISILVLVILTQDLSLMGFKQGVPLLILSALAATGSFFGLQRLDLEPKVYDLAIVDSSLFLLTNQGISAACAFIYLAIIALAHERVIREHFVQQMQALSQTAETLQSRLNSLEQDHYDLFRKIPSMTLVCDQDENIVVASDSFLRATGYVLENLVQKKFSQLLTVQDQEKTRSWNDTLQRLGRSSCQVEILNAKGEALHVHCATSLSKLQSTQSTAYLFAISYCVSAHEISPDR